jgi:hypothetical protein
MYDFFSPLRATPLPTLFSFFSFDSLLEQPPNAA